MGVNSIHILGNLGADPELRSTNSGAQVCEFRVAVNTGSGDSQETEWFTVICWDKLAEACAQYLKKGREVFVEGRIKTRSWEGDDGQRRFKTELIAFNVQFLGAPSDGGRRDDGPPPQRGGGRAPKRDARTEAWA